jgi:hypothetical protein
MFMRNWNRCEPQAQDIFVNHIHKVVPQGYHEYETGIKRNLTQTSEITYSASNPKPQALSIQIIVIVIKLIYELAPA